MLIKFFKNSFIVQYFALVPISVGLWIPGFLKLQVMAADPNLTTPLYNIIHPLLLILAVQPDHILHYCPDLRTDTQ